MQTARMETWPRLQTIVTQPERGVIAFAVLETAAAQASLFPCLCFSAAQRYTSTTACVQCKRGDICAGHSNSRLRSRSMFMDTFSSGQALLLVYQECRWRGKHVFLAGVCMLGPS